MRALTRTKSPARCFDPDIVVAGPVTPELPLHATLGAIPYSVKPAVR